MSRHTIPGSPHYVIGFDRPLGEFFIQIYSDPEDTPDAIEPLWDPEADLPEILGDRLPPGLIDALLAEAAGAADTNTVKTWHPQAAA
jgi:hypothetical protein